MIIPKLLIGATFTFLTDGDWTNASNWDMYPGVTLNATDTVQINAVSTIMLGEAILIDGYIGVAFGSTLINNGTLQVTGEFINGGTFNNFGSYSIDGYSLQTSCYNGGVINVDSLLVNDFEMVNDSIINVSMNAEFLNAGTFINNDNINIDGVFDNSFSLTNNDTVMVEGILELKNNGVSTFTNTDLINVSGEVIIESELLNNSSGLINVELAGKLDCANGAIFQNQGMLVIFGNANISNQADFSQEGLINIKSLGLMNVFLSIDPVLTP